MSVTPDEVRAAIQGDLNALADNFRQEVSNLEGRIAKLLEDHALKAASSHSTLGDRVTTLEGRVDNDADAVEGVRQAVGGVQSAVSSAVAAAVADHKAAVDAKVNEVLKVVADREVQLRANIAKSLHGVAEAIQNVI